MSERDSPEDSVGGGEIEATPVHFLHVAHAHVNEGDADAQVVLLVGRWEEVRAWPTGCSSRPRKGKKGGGGGTVGTRKWVGRR